MSFPTASDLLAVLDATWPAQEKQQLGPCTLRVGAGGGSRVSAATVQGKATPNDIKRAEEVMEDWGQPRLFMIKDGQDALDQILQIKGYAVMDPVWMYAAPINEIATNRPPPVTCFEVWPPLQVQAEIWANGGIGPERIAVMERAECSKTTLLGRTKDRPAATAFVGCYDGIAMLHALEVSSAFRRNGLAENLTRGAAFWAKDNGAETFSLVTTQANSAANALYSSLGMVRVGQYHYRIQH